MKRLVLSVLLLSFLSFSVIAQIEVPMTQSTLITKIAADWCPPCGGWGWDLFEGILEDNNDKAIVLAAHYSGGLQTDAAKAFATNFGATSQPRFFVNETDVNATSSNSATIRQEIQTTVDANSLLAPVAQTGILATYSENESDFTIQVNSQFFQEAEGDYYQAIYFVKKLVVAPQANQGDEAQHHNLLDEELSSAGVNPFGNEMISGSVPADFNFETTLTFSVNDGSFDYENKEVVVIIWKKVDGQYQFVNGNKADFEMNTTIDTKFITQLDQSLSIYPNVIADEFKVNFTTKQSVNQTQITLFNSQGQLIKVLFEGNLTNGQQSLELQRPNNTPAGIYFLRFNTDGGQITRRVVFE